MINIGSKLECFFDDYIIDKTKTTAKAILNKPIAREVVMEFDKDWEYNSSYVHFFYDEGIYKMYYIAWNRDKYIEGTNPYHKKIRCCYAQSKDGLKWEKPDLGLYDWMGNKHNNIIFMEDWLDNFYVFKDENPNCPSSKKYKATARTEDGLKYYYSSDGIHFNDGGYITHKGAFDTMNVIFWDKEVKKYRGYIRSFHDIPIEGGDYLDYVAQRENNNLRVIPGFDTDDAHAHGAGVLNLGKRDIRYMESDDFENWSEPKLLDFGESKDIALYTNCVMPYPYAEHIYIGFPTRYTERKQWTKCFDELCGKEKRLYNMEHLARRMGLAITDCLFMTSRDGYTFKRYDEAFFKNGAETGFNWVYGDCYPARGIIETQSIFEFADKEMSMLCPECTKSHEVLRRYTIRKDGFVSINAGENEEILTTKPFVFEGNTLYANMSTSGAGYMFFELCDKDGNKTESTEMFGDSTNKKIGFESDLSDFCGKEVVLKVTMQDADLYSIQFK